MFYSTKNFAITVATGLLLFLSASSASADPLLDQGLRKMAKEIKLYLDEQGFEKHVIVGDFSGSPKLRASGGVEISRSIVKQLMAVGVKVSDDAETQLMGKFKLGKKKQHPQDDFESIALVIEATVLDGDDDELAELSIAVYGSVALSIAGQTIDVPPKATEKVRQQTLIHQIKNPPTKIEDAKTKPSANSPFGIEILVVNGNRKVSRSPRVDTKNRAFVDLHRGEEYVVRLYNDASFEAAATLTIDGVDMFVDATDAPKDSRLILYPGKHIDVPGWYITKTHTKAFEIGGYEESVAKRVGNSTGIGTITATFRASWDPNGKPPADEPGGKAKGGKATKQGRDINKNYVRVIRDFGGVRSVVSIRYDR